MGELHHAYHTVMFVREVNRFEDNFYKSNLQSLEKLYERIIHHGREINKNRMQAGVQPEHVVDLAIDALGLKIQYARGQLTEDEYLQRRENLLSGRKA